MPASQKPSWYKADIANGTLSHFVVKLSHSLGFNSNQHSSRFKSWANCIYSNFIDIHFKFLMQHRLCSAMNRSGRCTPELFEKILWKNLSLQMICLDPSAIISISITIFAIIISHPVGITSLIPEIPNWRQVPRINPALWALLRYVFKISFSPIFFNFVVLLLMAVSLSAF